MLSQVVPDDSLIWWGLKFRSPGKDALVRYPLTPHRRDAVLALLRPLHDGSVSLVAEVPLGHDWARSRG